MVCMPTWPRLHIEVELRCVAVEAPRGSAGQSGSLHCQTLDKVAAGVMCSTLVRMSRCIQSYHIYPTCCPPMGINGTVRVRLTVCTASCISVPRRSLSLSFVLSLSFSLSVFPKQCVTVHYTLSDQRNCRKSHFVCLDRSESRFPIASTEI